VVECNGTAVEIAFTGFEYNVICIQFRGIGISNLGRGADKVNVQSGVIVNGLCCRCGV
jgi:hypothetical protein